MSVNDLVNDSFLILATLYENQVTVLNEIQIPLTQLDIAKALGFSKNKVYSVFKMLKKRGYIESVKRGKYTLTDKAVYIIENLYEMDKMLSAKESNKNE